MMKVKDFLNLWFDDISFKVYEKLIPSNTLVHRQTNSISNLLNSNEKFLEYEVIGLQMNNDLIVMTCVKRW